MATPWLWTLAFGQHEDRSVADARLRGDARGRDGGVREELAEGVKGMGRPADGSIQNGSSRSLISQNFLPESDPNRRSQRTLRNKRFFGASDPTADQRARSSWLRNLARTIEDRAADRMRQARARQRDVMQRGSAQGF